MNSLDPRVTSAALLLIVLISSGCIQSDSRNLEPDFDLDANTTSLNESGMEVYRASMSGAENVSDYSLESDNRMVMNLPGMSLSVNMTSEGELGGDSEISSSGVMGFSFAGNSNSTEFSTRLLSENGEFSRINDSEVYSREELGFTIEAVDEIDVNEASVLGVTDLNGEENILLSLDVNESDLMRNSESIFNVHSVVQESTDSEEDLGDIQDLNVAEAYLWTGTDRAPSKFAYYGSADNGTIQVRSVTEYRWDG
jgi:hypothetical protein